MNKTTEKISKETSVIDNDDSKLSVCGVMKDNAFDIIQKLESESPSIFQEYSDLYSRYLHSIQDVFGTCSLTEKQYFDKIGVDQNTLKIFDNSLKSVTNILKSQIDLSNSFVRTYIQFRLSSIDSWDKYMHTCINIYAQSFSRIYQKNQ